MAPRQPFLDGILTYIDNVTCNQPVSIASGGVASIFKGEYRTKENGREVQRAVAIKMLHGMHTDRELLTKFERRLEREGKNLRAAVHDNIVPFFGFSKPEVIEAFPSPGIVTLFCINGTIMEYLESNSMNESISGVGNRVKLVTDIARGLAHLHSLTYIEGGRTIVMVHGDIKPKNILILDNGSAAICDFGQSRIIEEKGYTTKLLVSAKYVAQEILMDEANADESEYEDPISGTSKMTSPEGDVYSFGMTALEVVSGTPPFQKLRRDVTVIRKVCEGIRPNRGDHKNISDPLWGLLTKSWDKDPKARPSMMEIRDELSSMHP